MQNFFKSTKESPYHLSVGVVLVNENKEVACHYFDEFQSPTDPERHFDFYILMRETVEPGESMEDAALRGIMEEFGSTGVIRRFLGTLVSRFNRGEHEMEKTTVYFLVDLESFDIDKRALDDAEESSEIRWLSPDYLIKKMQEQGKRYIRTDLDESEILVRAQKYLS